MKRTLVGFLVLFIMSTVSVYAQNEEQQYRKISSLVIINHVGHTIGLHVGNEFVDYVLPGERFVYNFSVFPGEVFPVEVLGWLNGQSSASFMRTIQYSENPTPVIFTKKSFNEEWVYVNPHRKIHVVIANETEHNLEIKHEGRLVGICSPNSTRSFMLFPGVMLVRSIRADQSKFIHYEITTPATLIIKDSDFWFP
ncbi:MAG: hypothetical protein HZA35_01940 [Parcubacteria group bacterium]|nr:hypothetical protein [Parcubacteria group bacterium]